MQLSEHWRENKGALLFSGGTTLGGMLINRAAETPPVIQEAATAAFEVTSSRGYTIGAFALSITFGVICFVRRPRGADEPLQEANLEVLEATVEKIDWEPAVPEPQTGLVEIPPHVA